MGNKIILNSTKTAIKTEVTEGTYVAPDAGSDFIAIASDNVEMGQARETIERNLLGSSIGQATPRQGTKSCTASFSVEAKAHGTEGTAPEYGLLLESLLGSTRAQGDVVTADDTNVAHSTTVIGLADADASKYNVGDVVTVQVSGDYHTSPISAVSNTPGAVSITLLVAADNAFTDGDVVSKVTTYYPAESGHKAISVTRYEGDEIRDKAIGCKVTGMTVSNLAVGQIPTFDFSLEGLTFERELSSLALTPSYDSALPPIALKACAYVDGTAIQINEMTLSVENTLGFITSLCSENGRISSRVTSRSITGTINPYKEDDTIANWTKFNNGTEFSLFISMNVPTSTSGEYEDVVGIYLPKCFITEIANADTDGNLHDVLTFNATRGTAEDTTEIYICFN